MFHQMEAPLLIQPFSCHWTSEASLCFFSLLSLSFAYYNITKIWLKKNLSVFCSCYFLCCISDLGRACVRASHIYVHTPRHLCGGQRTIWKNHFFPSTAWIVRFSSRRLYPLSRLIGCLVCLFVCLYRKNLMYFRQASKLIWHSGWPWTPDPPGCRDSRLLHLAWFMLVLGIKPRAWCTLG